MSCAVLRLSVFFMRIKVGLLVIGLDFDISTQLSKFSFYYIDFIAS